MTVWVVIGEVEGKANSFLSAFGRQRDAEKYADKMRETSEKTPPSVPPSDDDYCNFMWSVVELPLE